MISIKRIGRKARGYEHRGNISRIVVVVVLAAVVAVAIAAIDSDIA